MIPRATYRGIRRPFDNALYTLHLRKNVSWEDKLFVREVEYEGKVIRVVGC